ncbi:bifunctional demethylmenaquinone methyltransferase/2-methoxy-6-polyprenyl-1,4-benzoquinol methylase UbiE [Phormidium tenue]|uniref:2-phytyl-1,4-naphtoquinone methyltransferase n=1 Tax=Phormidium tenue NIES-30 TaxID=549789 RepID=A0A1U7J7T4_9CYAN|nr:bifunctional demethylmenaquinone methyltransferase/2-methoxy-6-polyprenyl-1,4-benzoquinol methylase UbiE [Phormidium tenue]MBD2231444.1 bifunctional demethylmenaquinone methyltransferase/2-methoxy-6-polyprenyl-1,4-benzoquinol methylase UbiE [Phormidium tenue FACHB-1052]OKH49221.1 bifunctional demethylmenaquinone methyltransferase/2-methoxy-6-polyprenyl-1,4-benzoquinol methylase [Phormidium tenue NIES-30]
MGFAQPPPTAPPTAAPTAADIQGLFDRIAPVYDRLNERLSFGLHRVWKRMAVRWSRAAPGQQVLDVCCGSGDLALLLAHQVGATGMVYGLDFSAELLAVADGRWQSLSGAEFRRAYLPAALHWVQGDALALPFEAHTFDAATMGYGLRNLTDIPQGLAELRRVLKPGASAAILDFHRPQGWVAEQFQRCYLETLVIPTADRMGLTDEYAYIGPSVDRFPTGPEQVKLARQAGFERAVHYPIAGGLMGVLVVSCHDRV